MNELIQSHVWVNLVTQAVVPVVIISACGLLCLTFNNRFMAIVSRIRQLQRERLHEYKLLFHLEEEKKGLKHQEAEHFLKMLESQIAKVTKRAKLMRNCLFYLLFTIGFLIIASLSLGASLFSQDFELLTAGFFILALIALFISIVFAIYELRLSLEPVQMESEFVQRLINAEQMQQKDS